MYARAEGKRHVHFLKMMHTLYIILFGSPRNMFLCLFAGKCRGSGREDRVHSQTCQICRGLQNKTDQGNQNTSGGHEPSAGT